MSKASKLVLMLFMGLLFAGKAHVQEVKHAPTIEQCRADRWLWLDKIERNPRAVREDYYTINSWAAEMLDCGSVDPENNLLYFNVAGEISSEKVARFTNFLDRHGLYDKFIEEDKAGKR